MHLQVCGAGTWQCVCASGAFNCRRLNQVYTDDRCDAAACELRWQLASIYDDYFGMIQGMYIMQAAPEKGEI